MQRLCDSTEPLVAAAANMLATYHWEATGDLDAAVKASRRGFEHFRDCGVPWLSALSRSRVGELCLQLEQGAEARDHLAAALPVLERLGAWPDAAGARSWLVLCNLQAGDTDEAERWLDSLPQHTLAAEEAKSFGYEFGVRAEVLFARGEVDAGLRLWRRALDLVRAAGASVSVGIPSGMDPWLIEARLVVVVAHARNNRLDLVADVADALPERLARRLTHPPVNPPPYLVEQSVCGTLLLAVATADLARAVEPAQFSAAARMIALAERFRFLRNFQPTMSGAAARADAERADKSAYDEAVSSYADLDGPGMRAAALDLLDQRVRSRL
jgi:tetratricopeptide (TPR) repeat protein